MASLTTTRRDEFIALLEERLNRADHDELLIVGQKPAADLQPCGGGGRVSLVRRPSLRRGKENRAHPAPVKGATGLVHVLGFILAADLLTPDLARVP